MKYCHCVFLCLLACGVAVNSLGYDRMDVIRGSQRSLISSGSRNNWQRNINGNSYTNGLVNNMGSTRISGGSCYDRCYDAYVTGLRRGTKGCSCSRFDFGFQGNRSGRRQNQMRNNCNCPLGTICEYEFGTVSCIDTRNRLVDPVFGSSDRRVFVHGRGGGMVNFGIPGNRRLGGHCGYFTSACLANHSDRSQVLRYTYSYELRTCIRQHVYLACEVGGARNNIFASRQGCSRSCM